MIGVQRYQSDLTHQSCSHLTNNHVLNIGSQEKISNSKICPKKFLTYTKAFRFQCICTDPKRHSSLLSWTNHQRIIRARSNSSRIFTRQIRINSSGISSRKNLHPFASSTTELPFVSQNEIPFGNNDENDELTRKAIVKCADWLMKYVFNTK